MEIRPKNFPRNRSILAALALLLAGCVAGGPPLSGSQSWPHLSPAECVDLAAIRNHAPATKALRESELAALRKAGYSPSPWDDPYYPDDLQAAQRLVDSWFKTDCPQGRPG
jgi:hypothetical protein